jgi:PAS domain S-box-containing protein
MLHRLLERQLRRLDLEPGAPPNPDAWRELLERISRAYEAIDRERYLVEHSIQVASREMQELSAKVTKEHEKLAGVFRVAPVGLAVADQAGRIVDFNQALEVIVGHSARDAIGRCLWDFMPAEDGEATQAAYWDLIAGRMSTNQGQRRLITKDGRVVSADLRLTGLQDDGGNTQLVIVSVEDVTGKSQLEVELRHSQKLESVGRLAAGIAHEINTPIQFVGDNVNFLSGSFDQLLVLCDRYRAACEKAAENPLTAEDLAGLRREEELADLDYIRTNGATSIASTIDGVSRVAKIVQSMKAFAHPDRGERATADLNAALQNTLTVATNELKYVATVETDFGSIPAIPCLVSDLNQVFLNLLVNAAHAIGDVVGKTGHRGVIRVRTYQEGSVVVIAISDTGTGIPEAVRGRIFDPFFTTKEVGKGTGQGLALARAVVVEQHGGALTFETEMGKGTTFFVRIPFDLMEV